MKLVKCSDDSKIIEHLTEVIQKHLRSGELVFWLVPGGSAIKVAAAVSKNLKDENLRNLTVTLTDERYGDLGHADENWLQLKAAGFDLPGADLHRVLVGDELNATTASQASFIYNELQSSDFAIGLFGIGADGHTAGIKPNSVAVSGNVLAEGYKSDDFTRVTMTTDAIKQLNEVVVYAFGAKKFPQIEDLLKKDIPLEQQPAQILKSVPKSTIYSDYVPTKN